MEKQLCLVLIKNKYDQLTNVEKKIADYILLNSGSVINMSIAELAIKADVAGSAIIRLCKTLGYEGYSKLKLSLAMELSETNEDIYLPAVNADDNTETVFEKVFESSIKTLRDTLNMMERNSINMAVEALFKAKQIYFFGVGTSSTIAIDAQYRIMQLGNSAYCATDILFMKVAAANMKKTDVAIGISHSGQTTATIETMKLAKESGAFTIVITSYKDSPICKYADIVINIYSEETRYPVEAVSARIAHISVLDAITVALSLKKYDNTLNQVKKTKDILKTIRQKGKNNV